MDMKKIANTSKRLAAALSRKLGDECYVKASALSIGMCEGRASEHVELSTVDIICPIDDRTEVDAAIAKACSKSRGWTVYTSRISADGASYGVSIACAEVVALAKAIDALCTTVKRINAYVHMSAATRYNKAREYAEGARAGEAAVNAYYERTALNVKVDQCIRRLLKAANARDVDAISADVQGELEPILNDARAMIEAAKAAAYITHAAETPVEAVEPAASAAAPEAVEMAVSATYTVDDGVEYMYTARVGGVGIGGASVIVYDDGDTYVERIDVDDGYRSHGYGTAMLKQLAAMYGGVYLAPDNDDARRLYARLGDDVTSKGSWGYVDQGYGVYAIAA